MDVLVKGKRIRLKPQNAIGKGGEADVYDIGGGQALKLFKQPDSPDLQGLPEQQQAARDRLAEHQFKLKQFPQNLPHRVISPEALVTDLKGDRIIGYTMKRLSNIEVLLKYSDRTFRQAGISHQTVVKIFQDLHATVSEVHHSDVIIGDFNDLNVLVRGTEAYLIDADSFQTPPFACRMFTARFVDPLLCNSQASQPILQSAYTLFSDWYAFAVMLMQCLLFVNPYGGIYRPKDSAKRIPHAARPLHRITVFHPEVQYPKPAIPYRVLPDDLLHYFSGVFERDIRQKFPRSLLDTLQWTHCTQCGIEHARTVCPDCTQSKPTSPPVLITVQGQVTATQIFYTKGTILYASQQRGKLQWIYHESGEFKRETGAVILTGELDPKLQFRICGNSTLVGKDNQVITLTSDRYPQRLATEMFDANSTIRYWIAGGQLLRDGRLGPEYIGDVLDKQTRFWVGENFGFGFYRGGHLNVTFVFDAKRQGISDRVKLPPDSGQLIDADCIFTNDRCWFFWTTQERGKTIHRCAVIRPTGEAIATCQAELGEDSWLGEIPSIRRGKCAAGHFLLVATDSGIIRVDPQNGQLVKTKEFPDTEPFVNTNCQLIAGQEGLYVVTQQEIQLLQIA